MTKLIRFDLNNFHTFGQTLLNKMKTVLSIFIKLKLIFSRMIILIMFEKILKVGWHPHSLEYDLKKCYNENTQGLDRLWDLSYERVPVESM